ncbi:alpha/beta hydrolase [Thioclava dalianensis]|uniref:Alpha/beta hydrolase n=1 Tax=Thioclava dalianensis TaxID=1185766 RepID=A0A074TAZ6_9RHOB|nr:alpha/beta hydrolase [Thioclava dalianensis]KEP68854.1 alpha/beta hydrolase [Thioclava dalianensis]SFN22533.1 Pimeloyl-ACP methyl ester carboxylesterase [Thioclava dalianensis]
MSPDQIIALIAALTAEPDPNAFSQLKNGGFDPSFPVTITACTRPVAPTEIEGKTVICGKIQVPFDHRKPEGKTIDIAFNLYKARSLSPQPDPVIYLHGGPGSGTVSRVAKTVSYFEHLRERRDIIAIDERGVDASAPDMDCYSTLGEQLGPVVDAIGGAAIPSLGLDFIKGCLKELEAKGIDYSLINTEQNAMDVPAVMSALGYDHYNIYGISYGTKLTMEILRQNPPGIRAAVIDGNAPPWLPLYSMFWQSHSTPIRKTLEPCERDPVCNAAYPDIIPRTFALIDKLGAEPVEGPNGKVGLEELFFTIDGRVDMKGHYAALSPYLPLMVTQLEKGETTIYDEITSGELPPKPASADADAARAAAQAAGLSASEMVLVDAMLAAADHMRIAESTVENAAQALEADLDAEARGTDLAEIFDDRLADAIRALDDPDERLAAGRDYLDLRFVKPSVDPLIALAKTHFDSETGATIAALARQLGPDDLTRVFDLIRIDNQATVKDVEGMLQLLLYACQEDFVDGWNSPEKFRALMIEDGSWGPVMQDIMVDWLSTPFVEPCALFDEHPRKDWTTIGSSDRPVLSMNGELDTQTAGIWGALAVQNYSNAQVVMVPESGHGTIQFSQCAKDITAAFIEDPTGKLDTSCVEDLRLPVMMPDGTMHPLPY